MQRHRSARQLAILLTAAAAWQTTHTRATDLVLLSDAAADQQLALPTDALSADPKVSGPAMARLAAAALAVYRAENRKEFLDTEFRLEDLTGRPKDAVSSLREFHALDGPAATTRIRA